MALTEQGIKNLETYNEDIKQNIDWGNWEGTGLYGTWNTFQYVAKNLGVWADDTTIGAETKQSLIRLANSLYTLMEQTVNLTKQIENFKNNQITINSGGNFSSKQYEAGDLSAFQ